MLRLLCLIGLLLCSLAIQLRAETLTAHAEFASQPAAVRVLRATMDLSATDLRDQAEVMREAAKDPTERAWATLALIEFETELEHEEATFVLLDELDQASLKIDKPDLRFAALTAMAVVNTHRNRLDRAQAALQQMRVQLAESPNPQWQTLLDHNEGVLQRKLGQFDDALKSFSRAAQRLRESEGGVWLAHELNSIGMLHGRTGRFSDAVIVHKEALQLARDGANKAEIARSLRLLGVLYRNLDDEERGTEYLREALSQIQRRNRREAIILTAELGISLMNMERFDEAAVFVEQAVTMAEESGNAPNKVNAYSRMADLELVRGHWEAAKRWVDRAWLEYDRVAVRDQVLLGLSRVRVYSARGATAETLLDARKTLAAARKLGDRILERAALDVVAELELGLGDATSAYVTRKAHQKLDKELAMDVAGRRIAVLEASLEQEKSQTERQLLTNESQIKDLLLTRQRYFGIALISGMIALIAVLTLLYFRVRTMRRANAELRANRDQLAQLHAALLKTSERLEHMATTDALTGIDNRRAMLGHIERAWHRYRADAAACLILVDLDHFKQINDRHGHMAGDAVLRGSATRMRDALPERAKLGRWGGEEFIIIVESTDEAEALRIAEGARTSLAHAFEFNDGLIPCSGSFGVAMISLELLSNTDDWIAAADRALYRAKREGRNRVQLASPNAADDLSLRTRATD